MDLSDLGDRLGGDLVTPEDENYDQARMAFALVADQRPAAVAYPESVQDVEEIVRFARENGLGVAPQTTGHGAPPLAGTLDGAILVKTERMKGVEIDAGARTARIAAGTQSGEVGPAAGEHGLAAIGGSSPTVGVAGFTLGGGFGWLSRKYGLATNSMLAAEIVTGAGETLRASAEENPDLFDAVRGGGGNFGVVTALEIKLRPIETVFAGTFIWDWAESERVLKAWVKWCADAPDEITTSARIFQFPPMPQVPEHLRGRNVVMIDGAYTGDPADGEKAIEALRALEPAEGDWAEMAAAELARLHGDPEEPVPGVSASAVLGNLDDAAVDTLLSLAGPDSGSPLLFAELRQIGGALGRPAEGAGNLPQIDGRFVLFALGMAMGPEMAQAAQGRANELVEALASYATGARYLNFTDASGKVAEGYSAEAYEALRQARAKYDPDGVMRANHPIPPA